MLSRVQKPSRPWCVEHVCENVCFHRRAAAEPWLIRRRDHGQTSAYLTGVSVRTPHASRGWAEVVWLVPPPCLRLRAAY